MDRGRPSFNYNHWADITSGSAFGAHVNARFKTCSGQYNINATQEYNIAFRNGVTNAFPKIDDDSGIIHGGHVM
jgi:hypothetical protein